MNPVAHGANATAVFSLLIMACVCLACSFHYAFVIVPPAAALSGPGIVPDLYPLWYASRVALLNHRDPYSPEVTRQIQNVMYQGRMANQNQQRFAYPLFAVLLFAPFALLPFSVAQSCFFVLSALATMWSVRLWLDKSVSPAATAICVVLVFSSFPVLLGLELRQPTMLVTAALAGVVSCVRSGRLVSAGVLGALATIKPQLAIGVLLPLVFWSVSDWKNRKAFLASLGCTVGGLLAISQWINPGWLPHWLATVRAYSHYAGAAPLICMLPGRRLPALAAALLTTATLAASWRWRKADSRLAIGFSASVFQVLMPFQLYNEVMLMPVVLWAFLQSSRRTGTLPSLLRISLWGLLGAGWLTTSAICMAHLIYPPSIARIWSLPIVIAWIFPIAALAYSMTCAGAPSDIAGVRFQNPGSNIPIPMLPSLPHSATR